jgi:hypothetical protein
MPSGVPAGLERGRIAQFNGYHMLRGSEPKMIDAGEMKWIRITGREDLPKKPGKRSYEYVDCLIFHEGEVKQRPWNCEHECWDDESGDDFYCDALAPTHYAVITKPLADTSAS